MSEPDPVGLACKALADAAMEAYFAVHNHGRHSESAGVALERIAGIVRHLPVVSTVAANSLLDEARRIHSERRIPARDGQILRVCAEDGQVWPCATAEALGAPRLVVFDPPTEGPVDPVSRPL